MHLRGELKKENVQVVALDPAPAPHVAIYFLIRELGTWAFRPVGPGGGPPPTNKKK